MAPTLETREGVSPIRLDTVVGELGASPNLCDQRKARDIQALIQLSRGAWAGRFALLGALANADRMLILVTQLIARGLVWSGRPQGHEQWTLALGMRHNYPLSLPAASFVQVVPYNPHVAHSAFVPEERGLPPELQQYIRALRMGQDGGCCFVRTAQWSPAVSHDLALAVWQVSRLLTGAHFFGEQGALNRHATSHYLALAEQGLLPLGPPLPPPRTPEAGAITRLQAGIAAEGGDDDIEWVAAEAPETAQTPGTPGEP